MRILVAEQLAPEGLQLLRAHHEVVELVGVPRAELLAALPEFDALMVRSQVKADAELIAAGTRLLVIGRAGVGVDNVDLEAATRAGITVVNAPTGNTIAAAEHTLALCFGLARRIAEGDAAMRRGDWKARGSLVGMELRGKTMGVIGLGKIGQAVAVRARAMEMAVLGADPYVTAEGAARLGIELVELPVLLERADVVTVHVPSTRETKGMVGAKELRRMKPTALLLNVARGGVVDEAAVAAALVDGKLGGAAFDVFDPEPPAADAPILAAPRTLLTPHLGASTAEAQVAVAEEAAEQMLEVLAGRPARYAVNAPLLAPETARALAPYLPLTELLGRFLAQYARSGIRTLTIEVAGELAAYDVGPLAAAALRGLLETVTTERVNLVNAAHLATSRGIAVVERKTPVAGTLAASVTLSAEVKGSRVAVGGTVAGGEPRLTRLDDHALDMAPGTTMLMTRHHDRPGMIGRVGMLLAEADVNISAMSLARSAPREDALMLLALDDEVPDGVAAAIRGLDGIVDVWAIRLGGER
ncbi:MAG: hypothetical protein RL338_685 [Chloroflexota bacterium]